MAKRTHPRATLWWWRGSGFSRAGTSSWHLTGSSGSSRKRRGGRAAGAQRRAGERPLCPRSTPRLSRRAAGTPGTSLGGPSSCAGEHHSAPAWRWAASSHPLSLLLLPRATWVTSASLACRDPRYCAWGGVFWVLCGRPEAGMLPGRASCTGMGRGVLLFGFLPDQCHSSRVRGPADPTKDAHWAPASLPWLCSRHCRLRKWAGKLRGVFQDTEESFLGGCPRPTGKHPIFCASLSPACLLQLPSTLHPRGRK